MVWTKEISMMITEYKVVSSTQGKELNDTVNNMLKEDWDLFGPATLGVSSSGFPYIIQTLVKYDNSLHGPQTQQVRKRVQSQGAD